MFDLPAKKHSQAYIHTVRTYR